MNNMKTYDGYLTVTNFTMEDMTAVRQLFTTEGLLIDISESALEFHFEGRDLSSRVIECFRKTAVIVGAAEGELRCEIDSETQDPIFEFYTINHNLLWRQTGMIIRSDLVEEI